MILFDSNYLIYDRNRYHYEPYSHKVFYGFHPNYRTKFLMPNLMEFGASTKEEVHKFIPTILIC
jgi:hypothetical protein